MTSGPNYFLLPVRHAMLAEAVRGVRFPCVLTPVSGVVKPVTVADETEFFEAFDRIAAALGEDDHVRVEECGQH